MASKEVDQNLIVFTGPPQPEEHDGKHFPILSPEEQIEQNILSAKLAKLQQEKRLKELREHLMKLGNLTEDDLQEKGRMMKVFTPSPFGDIPSSGSALLDAMMSPGERFHNYGSSPIEYDADLFDIQPLKRKELREIKDEVNSKEV